MHHWISCSVDCFFPFAHTPVFFSSANIRFLFCDVSDGSLQFLVHTPEFMIYLTIFFLKEISVTRWYITIPVLGLAAIRER
jgi:hypothetical protein